MLAAREANPLFTSWVDPGFLFQGAKISGIEPSPDQHKILVTSNDSRLRLFNLQDHSLTCKYKGLQNNSSQIRATFR